MAYYIESDDRELLDKLRQTNVCKECSGKLEARYDLVKHLPYLQCKSNSEHEGISKPYRERKELNIVTRREEMEKEYSKETTIALEQRRLPTSGALTGSQAMHILKLVYPNVPDDEIVRCAILCRDFGLHPLMKEVYIIPFGQGEKRTWATVLGIGATRKLMAQRGTFSYLDNTPRVMTSEEQILIFGEVDTKNIVAITKLRTREGDEAQGYGKWQKEKEPYGTDKGNTKANMAFIRSERNAFSRLFTDAIPQGIDVIDETYAEVPESRIVDVTTGEITEPEPSLKTSLDALSGKSDEVNPELSPSSEGSTASSGRLPLTSEKEEGDSFEKMASDIATNLGWKDSKPVRSWVVNKCHISEDKLTDIPYCRKEIWQLQGWR